MLWLLQRALFLNGEDVDAAANWLAERKALGNSNGSGNGMQASLPPPSMPTTGFEKAGSAVDDSGQRNLACYASCLFIMEKTLTTAPSVRCRPGSAVKHLFLLPNILDMQ